MHRSSNIVRVIKSRRLRWADHVAIMKEGSAFKILRGKPTGKRPLGKPRHRWKDTIRMYTRIKEIDINTRNWVDSVRDRDYWRDLVNTALHFRVS